MEELATYMPSLQASWEGRRASVHCRVFPINILMVDLGCIFPTVMKSIDNINIMVGGLVAFELLVQCVDSQIDLGTAGRRLGQL